MNQRRSSLFCLNEGGCSETVVYGFARRYQIPAHSVPSLWHLTLSSSAQQLPVLKQTSFYLANCMPNFFSENFAQVQVLIYLLARSSKLKLKEQDISKLSNMKALSTIALLAAIIAIAGPLWFKTLLWLNTAPFDPSVGKIAILSTDELSKYVRGSKC